MTMYSTRYFFPTTALLTLALFALTITGCKKDFTEPIDETTNQSLQFNALGGCENGAKLLQMAYQANPVFPVGFEKFVQLLNNTAQEEIQDLSNTSSNNLLVFLADNGFINWGSNFIGVSGGQGFSNWVNGTEKLRIKLGTSSNISGWKMICAGIWINSQSGTTVNVQIRRNGLNVQPPVVRNFPNGGRDFIPLSFSNLFDEIEISASTGRVQLNNGGTSTGTAFNRFIITDNSNDFIALRVRKGGYFWNSMVANDNQSMSNPDKQFLVAGDFTPTANGDEWILDAASTSYINHKANSFGPSSGANNDVSIDQGESMTFKIGPDVGFGASFTNAILPIYRPATNGTTARVVLNKGGSLVAAYNLTQQPGTLQYFLVGASGSDFDEIILTTISGSPAGSRIEFQSDYWSAARLYLCQSGGGGMLLQNMQVDSEEIAPSSPEQ